MVAGQALIDPDPAPQLVLVDGVQQRRVVGGHVLADDTDDLVIAVASGDEPALASDESHCRASFLACA